MLKLIPTVFLGMTLAATTARAQSVPTLTFTPVITTGLSQPLDIVRPPQDTTRLFIVEKGGRVRIIENGTTLRADTFLNIGALTSYSPTNERGLLSMVFHPQYATNRMFWVLYTNTAGDLSLARYQTQSANPNRADAASGVVVKAVPHPTNTNHNGGKLIFGPTDGLLYWSTGDGGGAGDQPNNAQNKNVLLGKMLRLDVNTSATPPYFIAPASNPFAGQTGADSLVYQFGLRNPYRWSFDRLNGDMWIADVGQSAWEEVNYAPAASTAGRDWGWRCREGAHVYSTNTTCAPGYTDPVFEYSHDTATGGLSITGGYVYRGSQYPALYGRYICVDYLTGNAWTVAPNSSGGFTGTLQTFIPTGLAGFGEDHRGELYAARLSGTIYRIGAQGGTPLGLGTAATQSVEHVRVSPVPANSGAPISLNGSHLRRVFLVDAAGRTVFSQPLDEGARFHTLELPALPGGIYSVRCVDVSGGVVITRIAIQ